MAGTSFGMGTLAFGRQLIRKVPIAGILVASTGLGSRQQPPARLTAPSVEEAVLARFSSRCVRRMPK